MSFPGEFIKTSAGRVFVHRGGASKRRTPLVLVHGFMMSHYIFRAVLRELETQYEVIALDLPGFGESDNPAPEQFSYSFLALADVVAEVLDELGVKRATLLGHSFGGGIALTLAARRPELIEKLLLVCATVYPLQLPLEVRAGLLPGGVGEFLFRHGFSKAEMKRAMRRDYVRDPRVISDEFIDYFWERFNRAGGTQAAYASFLTIAKMADNNSDPGRIKAPTLLVWGDEDRVVPLSHGKRLKRAIAGAELAIVPACGHFPFSERPEEFMRLVAPFLEAVKVPTAVTPVPTQPGSEKFA